jgi:hypothetical protein
MIWWRGHPGTRVRQDLPIKSERGPLRETPDPHQPNRGHDTALRVEIISSPRGRAPGVLDLLHPIVNDILRTKRRGTPAKGFPPSSSIHECLCKPEGGAGEDPSFGLRRGEGAGDFAHTQGRRAPRNESPTPITPRTSLTNYVLLELVMTLFLDQDKSIRELRRASVLV